MVRYDMIMSRAQARVGADTTTTAPADPAAAKADGLFAILFSTTGLLVVASVVGLWYFVSE